MKFQKHDWVKVLSLKREGEVMERLSSGQYRVALGDLALLCEEGDLLLVPDGKKERRKATNVATKMKREKASSLSSVSHWVDLHGLTVEEAIKLVETRIDRAILEGADSLRVLHGVGTGRLREALHKYLPKLGVVKSFRPDGDNPGVTWIYF